GHAGPEWKKVRSALNPSFSASKMKTMTPIIHRCVDVMLEVLHDHTDKGEMVNMLDVLQGLTLDVITKCALALQVDCQRNAADPMLAAVRKVFGDMDNILFDGLICFPLVRKIIQWIFPYSSYSDVTKQITDNVHKVIQLRRKKQGPRATDMLQLLLNAQEELDGATPGGGPDSSFLITDDHLVANSFGFLAAAFDTTSVTMAFAMHTLAKFPDEQDRIFHELTEVFPEKNQALTYDGIHRLERLDMVIREVLRLYPPVVLFTSRVCRKDTTVMGQFFPAGVNVLVPPWHIHRSPDVWQDPLKFDPERFSEPMSAHHLAAYSPFGLGPRMCIGKRFALLELKLAICRVLQEYRITEPDRMRDPIKLTVSTVVLKPERIEVRLERRK
ncbi:unnamed protein product, partial [Ixodes hexagonus]